MTQQEEQLLNGLIERVNGTSLANKDAAAERLLTGSLGKNPDALYVLCQTVLVQQFAMENAQRQLTEARSELDTLKQQAGKPEEHGSFLGNLFGLGKSDALQPTSAPPSQPPYGGAPTGYTPVHNPAAPQYGGYAPQQPGYGQPAYGGGVPMGGGMPVGGGMFGGGGGFLQGAMQTAAGVVAGEFAFRAIEDVFHGFGGGGGRGFEGGGTEVVNNYYGNDSNDDNSGGFGDRLRDADGLGNGISPDIEDRRGESSSFFGSADDSGDDGSSFAGNSVDDNSSDFGSDNYDSGDTGGNDDSGF